MKTPRRGQSLGWIVPAVWLALSVGCGASTRKSTTGSGGSGAAGQDAIGGQPAPGGTAGQGSGGASGGSDGGGATAASGGQSPGGAAGVAGNAAGGTSGAGGDAGGGAPGTTYVYVSGSSSTIRTYRLNTASGTLEYSSINTDGGNTPSYLAFHPNKKFLYAVNEAGANSKLLAFAIDGQGALTKLATNGESPTAPGEGPPHLTVHPSGKWVIAAHYGSGHTTVHPIMANGGLGPLATFAKTASNEAHQAKLDPTGKFLMVPCRTPNFVAQYTFDEATGKLTANSVASVVAPTAGTGPRHMDFHPNGRWAYVLGELNGHVIEYDYDGTTGRLSHPQEIETEFGETSAAHILVHPNGHFAFVSLRKTNEIVTLSLNSQTGAPFALAHQTTMIDTPRDFTIDPSGQLLLVANQGSGDVLVFSIDQTGGRLTMRSKVATAGINQPQFVGAITLP
jgi:6-phosphogluconolactonase